MFFAARDVWGDAALEPRTDVSATESGAAPLRLPPVLDATRIGLAMPRSIVGRSGSSFGVVPTSHWVVETPDVELAQRGDSAIIQEQQRRIEQLEAEMHALSERLELSVPPDDCCAPPGRCRCKRRETYYGPGIYAGFEMTFLKPFFEDAAQEDAFSNGVDRQMEPAPRVWVGVVNASGAGLRARYWHYDHSSKPGHVSHFFTVPKPAIMTIAAHIVELEGTNQWWVSNQMFTGGAGVRYAFFGQEFGDQAGTALLFKKFQGVGPMLSAGTRRPLGNSGWALVSDIRGSILFGESRQANDLTGVSRDASDMNSSVELQVGGEWSRRLRSGHRFYLRGMLEGQLWMGAGTFVEGSDTVFDAVFDGANVSPDDHDVGFIGFSFMVGVSR